MDAYVYLSNCGIRQFSVRLPAKCFNTAISDADSAIQAFRARNDGEFVVLDFLGDDQGADETEGEGWMDSLLPLRADLLRGDQRCLYLGWLCTLEIDDFDEEEPEPPVPRGLQSLTES